MGLFISKDQKKKKKENKAKKVAKSAIKAAISKVIAIVSMLLIKMIPLIFVFFIVISVIDFVVEIFTAKNTPEKIYSNLEIENMVELVEIKGDENSGYYLDFVDDLDDKLDKLIEEINKRAGYHNLPEDKDFLKKMIKAEVVTQFPDLGGEIPEGSDGFQGAVSVRRISPNKTIGEMKNTAKGETSTIEQEEVDEETISTSKYENIVKQWKQGEKILVSHNSYVYKQTESTINPGDDTGDWNPIKNESGSKKIKIEEGSYVTYTGTYKSHTNSSNKVTIYVEIEYGSIKGFVKAQNLTKESKEQETATTIKVSNKQEITSRAKKKKVGEDGKQYVIAIAAGHNEGESEEDAPGAEANGLKERELTIKVAEKVEKLFEEYSNVTVVQTGSTSDNPGGVKNKDRKKLARDANPDLCIQIHFNMGGGTGVEAIYKEGDGISQQLAEVLSSSIATEMGLKDRKAGPDVEKAAVGSLTIIENSATSGFPSVVTEGGFLDGEPDVTLLKGDGIDKYAEGIVKGVVKYLEMDHSGYSATAKGKQTVTDSIESKVVNMKYVTQDKMKEYIKNGNQEALNVFTINDDKNVVTTTWIKKEDGTIEIKENAPMDLRTALQKYVVPYEYLLYYYIDTDEEGFSDELADEILNSEIVMAVHDNVTTTKKTETTEEKTEASDKNYSKGWHDVGESKVTTTENCNTKVAITYVNTWFVKAYNQNSYSSEVLDMGNADEKIIEIKGTVTETKGETTLSETKKTDSGTKKTYQRDENYNEIEYTYTTYQRIRTEVDIISNSYEDGEMKTEGKENKFIKLYKKHDMEQMVREDYLFQIITNNEKTANLLNLTKYLIYKATDESYGVVEFDFSEFGFSTSVGTTGSNIGTEWTKTWENGTLWRYMNGKISYNSYISRFVSQDKTVYYSYSDYPVLNCTIDNQNFSYGVMWHNEGKTFNTEAFKEAGVDLSTLAVQKGTTVSVEVADYVFEKEWRGKQSYVLNFLSKNGITLDDTKLNCLTDIDYQGWLRGRQSSFISAYKQGENSSAMQEWILGANGGHGYGDSRAQARWKLWSTGVYDGGACGILDPASYSSGDGNAIVERAKAEQGKPYIWGACGPSGYDCSGLVSYALLGKHEHRWTASAFTKWQEVSASEAKPGYVVATTSHCGIYIGNGKMIHAPHTGDVVKISNVQSKMKYYKPPDEYLSE